MLNFIHISAASRTASPTRYQLSYSGPLPLKTFQLNAAQGHLKEKRKDKYVLQVFQQSFSVNYRYEKIMVSSNVCLSVV